MSTDKHAANADALAKDLAQQTEEWQAALDDVIEFSGSSAAETLLAQLNHYAARQHLAVDTVNTPYLNTIPSSAQASMPDDGQLLERIIAYNRWNAVVMVMRAGQKGKSLGGHLSTYAGSAQIIEVGINYFFKGYDAHRQQEADLVLFQGHAIEGIYSRAYLEDRLSEEQLDNFRQEAFANGVSSYPHPHLMPDFWQLPTVSMGLGPLMAIFQAQFLKYLHHRGLSDTEGRTVWSYCGDGEMSEPESLGMLMLAGREKLDNLVFIVNCNLQRLDGPVSGNSQIIQELEGVYRGAGWHVIKVIWGRVWEGIFAKDTSGLMLKRISELVDGEYQCFCAKGGAYLRDQFFGKYPELLTLVEDMTDTELERLCDGGHDLQKIYAAYAAAKAYTGKPVAILIKTVKGYGLGKEAEALNITHNLEKISVDALKQLRDRFNIPVSDEEIVQLPFVKHAKGSAEYQYLMAQRNTLGGWIPQRIAECPKLPVPELSLFKAVLEGSGDREVSSTMMFSRIISALLKDKGIKEHIVPIVADEARTLGLEGLFRQIGIYAPQGQKYTPEDRKQLIYYKEDSKGQLLQQGISEAGAMASWIAAATAYVNSHVPMVPFYVYYAMFGYQRVGDFVWAAADMHARGFIVGGLAGRTTLSGEGLQHQDAHNLLMFSFVPNCISYDPTFGYELAVIVQDGLRRMVDEQEDVFYYLTMMNEAYVHPSMPEGAEEGILKGMYCLAPSALTEHKATGKDKAASSKKEKATNKKTAADDDALHVHLLGAGAILNEALKAQTILADEFNIAADVWSVTSFNQLRRDVIDVERYNRLNAPKTPRASYLTTCLQKRSGPVIAATDYIRLMADQVREAVPDDYYVLGTDGFGRSDGRAELRDFFEVDAKMIAYTAVYALVKQERLPETILKTARKKLGIDASRVNPMML